MYVECISKKAPVGNVIIYQSGSLTNSNERLIDDSSSVAVALRATACLPLLTKCGNYTSVGV